MNLAQPTMQLSAYGGFQTWDLVKYVTGPSNPVPKPIQAEVVDVEGLLVTCLVNIKISLSSTSLSQPTSVVVI